MKKYRKTIHSTLRFLLCHLKIFHRQLILFQYSQGWNVVSNAETQFIKWLNDILFESKRNFLPVFGDTIVENLEQESIYIGPVQKYLINEYFSAEDPTSKVSQVSLAIICYWYQKFNSYYFFEKEKDYWRVMIEHLGIMMSNGESHSLESFDEEGNYHPR